jgi:prepilin-type N-terminal cleavage/methylation domain-containing protein
MKKNTAIIQQEINSQQGFTLIELLVTTSIAVMLLLSASAIFMTFLIGSAKNNLALRVKSEGSSALNQINFLLRNSLELETCESNMTEITLTSVDNLQTTLGTGTDPNDSRLKIASSGANGTFYLTSGQNNLTDSPPIIFNCVSNGNNRFVDIIFSLHQGGNSGATQSDNENVVQTFSTSVNLRN